MNKQKIIKHIPRFIKDLYHNFTDNLSKQQLFPPMKLISDGSKNIQDFITTGNQYLFFFRSLGKLTSNQIVLDVGCGAGRIAIPLTKYITKGYFGFDISKKQINWCKMHISRKFPNFAFKYVDIYNGLYNPKGTINPEGFKFPYMNSCFDFICLTSIFTHLKRTAVENYMKEVSRVLKKGGTCFITFFLMNEETKSMIQDGNSIFNFNLFRDNSWSIENRMIEFAIAYDEKYIKQLFQANNLEIIEIHRGSWYKTTSATDCLQDIIIARRLNE